MAQIINEQFFLDSAPVSNFTEYNGEKYIEMKTISKAVETPRRVLFKIKHTSQCMKKTSKDTFCYIPIYVHSGEIYSGKMIVHNNRVYIDISENFISTSLKTVYSRVFWNEIDLVGNLLPKCAICIPILFDMSGKTMINVIESKQII